MQMQYSVGLNPEELSSVCMLSVVNRFEQVLQPSDLS